MRKIKITALLLAVLMIVTAFAGCASKSTVTNLDNKVNDLDASIEEQKAALSGIESTLATISKALENQGSSDNLEEVLKDVQEKNAADLEAAIKDLQATIDGYHKDDDKEPETQAPVTEDVKVAASQYSAKLEAFEGTIDDDKVNYTADDLAAIRDIIGKAEAAIANSTSADEAKKAYEDAVAAVAGYPSVNGKLYAYVVELKGNITDESAAKVAEADKALEDAIKFYEKHGDKGGINSDALTAYEVSATEDMDLVDEINKLVIAQEVTLVNIKNRAADLNKEIAAIDASYSFGKISDIVVKYKVWARDAAELSPKNVALVTGYDALMAAQASALNATAAKAIFEADKVLSKLYGTFDTPVSIFADYDALKAGVKVAGTPEQVIFTYATKNTKGEEVLGLTSEIYAAIDAKIAAWQEEYELIDDAVEYVINTVKGDVHYYEKYKADRALVQAFEADYNKFVAADGVFTAIKALNNKRLGADAVELALAYEKNGWDINNWKKTSEEAYAAEVAADVNGYRNILEGDYAAVLENNFNAMVNYADLCQYNGDAKYPEYGVKEPDPTDPTKIVYNDYTDGFVTWGDDEPEKIYLKLYDFSDAKLQNFITTEYKDAKAAAKDINKMIEGFKPAQAISIRSIVEGIGGYVKLNATGDKILAIDEADIWTSISKPDPADATKKILDKDKVDTIAQFEYAYDTMRVYDLTPLLKLDLYAEKLALAEARIEAADKVAAELNSAYAALVGNKPTALVTMDNVDAVAKVYNIYTQKWLKQARVDIDVAKVVNTTGAGVKEYEIKNILVPYTAINGQVGTTYKVLDSANGMIVKLNQRANLLKHEAALVTSAYEMLGKMNDFNANAFGANAMTNQGYISGMYSGSQNNAYIYGIVAIDVSDAPMTDDGVDASGMAYKKDQYKWTVTYVTFDNGDSNKAIFKTKQLVGYYYGNDKNYLDDKVVKENNAAGLPDQNKALADDLKPLVWSANKGGTVSGNAGISKEVLVNIPKYVVDNDIKDMMTNKLGVNDKSMKGMLIPAYALAALALELDARFQLDNYGTYAGIEDMKEKKDFDPANGGYGFTFIKGMTLMALLADSRLSLVEEHKVAIKASADLNELRGAVNNAVKESGEDDRENASDYIPLNIAFGDYIFVEDGSATDVYNPFDIEGSFAAYEIANYENDFGLDKDDFKVEGIVIYKECTHNSSVSPCPHKANVCTECGEIIPATTASLKFEIVEVSVAAPFKGFATRIDLKVTCTATGCDVVEERSIVPGEANTFEITNNTGVAESVDAGDVIEFNFDYEGTTYTLTSTFDGTKWGAVTEVTP